MLEFYLNMNDNQIMKNDEAIQLLKTYTTRDSVQKYLIFRLASNEYLSNLINDIYTQNEMHYYDLYLKNKEKYENIQKYCLFIAEKNLIRLIGIFEEYLLDNDISNISKLFNKGYKKAYNYFKNNSNSTELNINEFMDYILNQNSEKAKTDCLYVVEIELIFIFLCCHYNKKMIVSNIERIYHYEYIEYCENSYNDNVSHFMKTQKEVEYLKKSLQINFKFKNITQLVESIEANRVNNIYTNAVSELFNCSYDSNNPIYKENSINELFKKMHFTSQRGEVSVSEIINNSINIQHLCGNGMKSNMIKTMRNLYDNNKSIYDSFGVPLNFYGYIFQKMQLSMDDLISSTEITNDDLTLILSSIDRLLELNNIENTDKSLNRTFVSFLIIFALLKRYKTDKELFFKDDIDKFYSKLKEKEEYLISKEAELSSQYAIISDKDKEIQELKRKIKELNKDHKKELKIKEREVNSLKDDLQKKNYCDKEYQALVTMNYYDFEDFSKEDNNETIEEFSKYIESKSVALIGGHQSLYNKLKSVKEELFYMSPENNLNKDLSFLDKSDIVFIYYNYMNHAMYHKIMNKIASNKSKLVFIKNTNLDIIYKQLTN